MELDELKTTWQQLEQKLERQNAISAALLRHQELKRARSSMWPLVLGQSIQIAWGIFFILGAALLWSTKPHAVSVIIAGVIVHAYGIGCILTAGLVLSAVQRIDYSGSVLDAQNRLARIRRNYVISGLVAGFTWWLFWIPSLMVLAALVHVNLYAHAPSVIWIGTAIGCLGLLSMAWGYMYSRKFPDSSLRRSVDETIYGKSLQRVQAQLNELRQFEEETP